MVKFGVKFNYNQLGITVVPVLIITIDTIVYNPCYLLVQIRSYLSPLGLSKRGQNAVKAVIRDHGMVKCDSTSSKVGIKRNEFG